MTSERIPLLMGVLLFLHFLFPVGYWLEARFRPVLRRIGILDSEADYLHRTALMYHQMGVQVELSLLVPLFSNRLAEARLLERRILIECIALVIIAVIPSGVFLFSATF